MKKSLILKNTLLTAALVAGMQIVTSCNGCSRKDETMTTTEGRVDTVYIDTCMTPHDTVAVGYDGKASGTSIHANGTNGTAHNSTDASGAGKGTATTGKGTATSGTKKAGLTEDEITNQVENSGASRATNSKGEPIISGGTSGSGQGTGTGSTGNNSRVTTKKDQLTH